MKREQVADDEKKQYCDTEIEATQKKYNHTLGAIAALETDIEAKEDEVQTFQTQVDDKVQEIKDLDKHVSDITEVRKTENSEYVGNVAMLSNSIGVLQRAEARLQAYYRNAQGVEGSTQVLQVLS